MMSTTLPLFWNLSSSNKNERIDASVKLIGALERFQEEFSPTVSSEEEVASDIANDGGRDGDSLNTLNAHDVSYSIRRLVRGLASPRESSRLGFAVALTELLLRIDTVTCSQIVNLILDSSRTQGSMTGQEERDVLFARLFGLTVVIQSGLIVRTTYSQPSTSSMVASDATSFVTVVSHLLSLSNSKSWLREGAWWNVKLAVDCVAGSNVPWRDEALQSTARAVYMEDKNWSPEKLALTLSLQRACPSLDWARLLSPPLKVPDILAPTNLPTVARILKDPGVRDDEELGLKSSTGMWTPKLHFAWDTLLDEVTSGPAGGSAVCTLPEFFRILVDESLFAASSSSERKFWGFQVFRKALATASATDMPMLFTKNFMRSWINHLSSNDRHLHKAAKQVVNDIQTLVNQNPALGFTLVLQLTGVHGNQQFDRLTRTKTVESILTSMDDNGIRDYIQYVLDQTNAKQVATHGNLSGIDACRTWAIDQFSFLIRNGAIPKTDAWVKGILDWLLVNGLYVVHKGAEKSEFWALRTVPLPYFSDDLRKACRLRLLSCLADLTGQASTTRVGKDLATLLHIPFIGADDRNVRSVGVAMDGQLWICKVLETIESLSDKPKNVQLTVTVDGPCRELRTRALHAVRQLDKASTSHNEYTTGAKILLAATVVYHYCSYTDMGSASDLLTDCVDGVSNFLTQGAQSKLGETTENEAINTLVNVVIHFLEVGTSFTRSIANQAFAYLSGALDLSAVDTIVSYLTDQGPVEPGTDGSNATEGSTVPADGDSRDGSNSEDDASEVEDVSQLREDVEQTLRTNGVELASEHSGSPSEEELMDDDQMMAIDEHLAAVFKARVDEKGRGTVNVQREATHFKNRLLDLVDTYLRKHSSNVLAIRFLSPLVDLLVGSGSDEKQLADKAASILRSKLGKSKEIVAIGDKEDARNALQELHMRARTAPSPEVLATLSQCSLYLTKGMLHANAQDDVVELYRESLADFLTRKASKLNGQFFHDLIHRHPAVGWELRSDMLTIGGQAVNGYRKTQMFQLLQTLLSQVPPQNQEGSILDFIPNLLQSVYAAIHAACDDKFLTPAQAKEILKSALFVMRQSKRLVQQSQEASAAVWDPSRWNVLAQRLANSASLKSSIGLQNLCKQIAQLAEPIPTSNPVPPKRKVGTLEHGDATSKPPKRKKMKKIKA